MELDEKLAEIKNKLSEKRGRFFFGILAEMGCISQFDNAREFQKLMCQKKFQFEDEDHLFKYNV